MSYNTHGFVSGMKLSGQVMAELDNQIALNETNIAVERDRIDAIPSQRLQEIRKLTLATDSDSVYLYYGAELLSSISIPDVSDRVPCTDLTATGTLTDLIVGGTAAITATRQPSNCNQNIRYMSMDTSIATVTSTGLVTAVGSGSTSIQVSCGSYSVTLNVKVSRTVSFVGNISGECGWLNMNGYGDYSGATFTVDGSNEYLGNFPFDLEKYKIKDGEKITLTVKESGWKLRPGFVVKAISGLTPEAINYDESERYLVANVEQVESITNGATSYTYTNNTGVDCWIVFTVHHSGSTVEQALTNIDSKLSMIIGPA